MKKFTSRIVALLIIGLMICTMLPLSALAAEGKVERTFYNPVTNRTDSVLLNADTTVAAIWTDDGKIQAEGQSFDAVTTGSKLTLPGTSTARVIYLVIGNVELNKTISPQDNSYNYIVGADGTDATITRGPSAKSDLIMVGNTISDFGMYNLTLNGGGAGTEPGTSNWNDAMTGGLLAIDNGDRPVYLKNVTITGNSITHYVADEASEDHGTGAVRIGTGTSTSFSATANVTMEDCTICNNYSYGYGTGIFLGTNATLTLKGRTSIYGNLSRNYVARPGAGIYMFGNAKLKMQDTAEVYGNYSKSDTDGRTLSDIFVRNNIEVTGSLVSTANRIGIDNRGDQEVFAVGTGMTGDSIPDPQIFLHDNDAGCHNHQTANGMIFCADTHSVTPTPTQYTVTYTDGVDDEVIFDDQRYTVDGGSSTPAFAGTPVRDGYEFTGWTPVVAETVTGDAVYTAQWKKVDDGEEKDSYPGMTKAADKTSVGTGDEVTYTLTTNVPDTLGDYIEPGSVTEPGISTASLDPVEKNGGTYPIVIHDELNPALTYTGIDSITVNGRQLTSSLYQVIRPCDDTCTFEIYMDLVEIYKAGYFTFEEIETCPAIVVTYKAQFNGTQTGVFENTAWVEYPDGESEHSTVEVTSYGIKIFKYDQADKTVGLAGAVFELTDSSGKLIDTLTSDNTGWASYSALAAGTYYLTETKAPEGYVKSDKPLTIELPKDAGGTTYYATSEFANVSIPHTGGSGTMMYTVGGIAILLVAGVFFIISRKRRNAQAE